MCNPPLVLRKATHPGYTCWELVDPAAAPSDPPAAVAVTRAAPDATVTILSIAPAAAAGQLIPELLAALRRTDATRVRARSSDQVLVAALLAEDFVADGEGYTLTL